MLNRFWLFVFLLADFLGIGCCLFSVFFYSPTGILDDTIPVLLAKTIVGILVAILIIILLLRSGEPSKRRAKKFFIAMEGLPPGARFGTYHRLREVLADEEPYPD